MRRARWFVVGAVIAVLAALGVWSPWSVVETPGLAAPAEASERASPEAPGEKRGADLPREDGPVSAAARESLVPGPDPTAERASAPSREIEVEIFDAETGRPVSGAEVWYRPQSEPFDPGGFEKLIARSDSRSVEADASGVVRVPLGSEVMLVAARAPARLGGELLEPPGDPSRRERIELYPDWDLVVEVSDADGRPASGVPISVQFTQGTSYDETAPDGRARWPHLGVELARDGDIGAVVRVDLMLEQPLVAELSHASRAPEPVRFALPPLAALEVLVLDPEHRPVADDTEIALGLVRADEPRELSPFADRERDYVYGQTRSGRARFERVGLGGELEVVVTEERSGAGESHFLRGPLVAGEERAETIVLRRAWPILSLRAVDAAGAPLAGAKLTLDLHQRSGHDIVDLAHEETTDPAGRFEVDLPTPFVEGAGRWLAVALADGSRGGRVDLARAFPAATVELGDVVLAELPLLASGRVIGDGGDALAGARIEALVPIMNQEDGGGGVWYWDELGIPVESAPDGAFVLRALVDAGNVRLTAIRGELRSGTVEVPLGSTGLALVARAAGSIGGTVLCAPGVPADLVRMRLLRAETADDQRELESACEVAPDGSFRSGELLPGLYTLFAGVEQRERLVSVERIEVRSGERCDDPRLAAIDLRGIVHGLRFTLRAPQGSDELHGHVFCRAAGAPAEDDVMTWFRGSSVRLLTPHPSVDGRLVVDGFRPVTFAGASGERGVDLVPGLMVELVLPASIDLPEPPAFLKAALVPGEDYWMVDHAVAPFDEARRITCRVPQPGPLRVYWMLERRGTRSSSLDPLAIEPAQWIEVRDVESPQHFELEIANPVLAAAIAAVREH